MSKTYSYERQISTQLKITGFLDNDAMIIEDEEGKKYDLTTLLSDFNGAPVTLTVAVKTKEDLSES